jgi:hypothetical protein
MSDTPIYDDVVVWDWKRRYARAIENHEEVFVTITEFSIGCDYE